MRPLDRFIVEFDVALRSVAGGANAHRSVPVVSAGAVDHLTPSERQHAAGLMRINHVGEVCAQALYQSQKLVARKPEIREALNRAGQEEIDHMAWCEQRVTELGSHGQAALDAGGMPLPDPVKKLMGIVSKLMTSTAYKI